MFRRMRVRKTEEKWFKLNGKYIEETEKTKRINKNDREFTETWRSYWNFMLIFLDFPAMCLYFTMPHYLICLWERVFLTMFTKAFLTCSFLKLYIKGFSMGATEVFRTATPLLRDTLSFAEGLIYIKMQLP